MFLHGVVYDNNSQLTDQPFAALHALGPRAPGIAFPYGDQSHWHDRADGAWGSYVFDEVIPKALTVLNADPRRVAIGGLSMGGFGAYALARLEPGRFCAVGGHSAAISPTCSVSEFADPGAFDNARNFARNDVIAAARRNPKLYGHAQLWLDGGAQDPFHDADEQLAGALHIHTRTCGRAATTSRTGTRTGATTWASTPTRSQPADRVPLTARRTSSPGTALAALQASRRSPQLPLVLANLETRRASALGPRLPICSELR